MINKDTILYRDNLLGNYTIQDLINYLESIIKHQKEFNNIVIDILKNNNFTDDEILDILIKNSTSDIKFIADMLKGNF